MTRWCSRIYCKQREIRAVSSGSELTGRNDLMCLPAGNRWFGIDDEDDDGADLDKRRMVPLFAIHHRGVGIFEHWMCNDLDGLTQDMYFIERRGVGEVIGIV